MNLAMTARASLIALVIFAAATTPARATPACQDSPAPSGGATVPVPAPKEPSPAPAPATAPDAAQVLRKVTAEVTAKTLNSSFLAQCLVSGGISTSPDHKLIRLRTADAFSAEIHEGIMRVAEYDAFRTLERGAIKRKEKEVWQDTAADLVGKRVERLLSFPHEILKEALEHGATVSWKWIGDEQEIIEKKEEGRTGVVEKRTKPPHMLRIDFSRDHALDQLERIRNSGCMDANTNTECTGISEFIANLDRSETSAFCEIDLNPEYTLPKTIRLVVLTGVKKPAVDTTAPSPAPEKEEHVAFQFDYTLDQWDAVEKFAIPKGAKKVLGIN